MSLDASGAVVWDSVFGAPAQAGDWISDMVALPGGDVVVGLFRNDLDLGSVTLTTEDASGFMARFSALP